MERRTLISFAGAFLTWRFASAAQQPAPVPTIGVLIPVAGPRAGTVDTVRQGLRDLGYIDGTNIRFDLRFAGGRPETFPGLAVDLVGQKVDVVFAIGPAAVRAAKGATDAIPIVALDLESDPVLAGFVRSFAVPGSNVTGCFLDQTSLTRKWLELIAEAVPNVRRVAVLRDPSTGPYQLDAIKAAAANLKIEVQILQIKSGDELVPALEAGVKDGTQALVQLSSPLFGSAAFAARLAESTAKHRLPTISGFREFPDAGGFASFGPDRVEYYKQLPVCIDKILKGANPAETSIEQPAKFDLVVNLKAAKTLGLAIPSSLRERAQLLE